MGIGNQPAQRTVAGTVVVSVGQHDDAARELGAEVAVVVEDRKVHPDDGIQSRGHAGLEVLDGAVQAVPVRAGERRGAVCCGRLGELIRPGHPVVGAEGGGDVEMGEAHADSWPEGVVDPQQPPAAAADMPGQVKGEAAFRPRRVLGIGWADLDPPDLVVHQPRPAPQRRPGFLRPPLAPFIPADRFGADRVLPAGPVKFQRLAGGCADDITASLNMPIAPPGTALPTPQQVTVACDRKRLEMRFFEYIFE